MKLFNTMPFKLRPLPAALVVAVVACRVMRKSVQPKRRPRNSLLRKDQKEVTCIAASNIALSSTTVTVSLCWMLWCARMGDLYSSKTTCHWFPSPLAVPVAMHVPNQN